MSSMSNYDSSWTGNITTKYPSTSKNWIHEKKNKNELQKFFTIWIANIKVKKREVTTYEFID